MGKKIVLEKRNYYVYQTPLGRITIAANNDAIIRLAFGEVVFEGPKVASSLTNKAANQLQEYLAGKRSVFDLPLYAQGSEFQQCVWEEVLKIPYGQTRTYSEVAAAIGNPKATRAVGMANNKNPLPILIPCHRVIGAQGKPVGYSGGLKIKEFLLNLEQRASVSHS